MVSDPIFHLQTSLQCVNVNQSYKNAIGCGIYQDKFIIYHLARWYNFAWISGQDIPLFFLVKTAYSFNSLKTRRGVLTVLPDFSDFI